MVCKPGGLPVTTVKELFAMSNETLLAEWREAKLIEIEARIAKKTLAAKTTLDREVIADSRALEENKLMVELIRLVISFRLTGRDVEPPEADE
jgi:hypothetical protein